MIESSGMSKSEIKQIGKQQGISTKNIEKVLESESDSKTMEISPIEDFDSPQLPALEKSNESPRKNENQNIIDDGKNVYDDINPLPIVDESVSGEKKTSVLFNRSLNHFGYDIFNGDPSIFQPTSLGVVDPDYLIGPGDEVIVMLWGETQFRQVLKVDREGFVFIPEIGQVFVNGLNLNLLESKFFRVLSQSYASLNPQGGKATTFFRY